MLRILTPTSKITKIKDVLPLFNGLFSRMKTAPWVEDVDGETLDIDFLSKYGEREISPLLRMFMEEDGTLSDVKLSKLAIYLAKKYDRQWKSSKSINETDYDPTTTYHIKEIENVDIDRNTLNNISQELRNSINTGETQTKSEILSKIGKIINDITNTDTNRDGRTIKNITANETTTNIENSHLPNSSEKTTRVLTPEITQVKSYESNEVSELVKTGNINNLQNGEKVTTAKNVTNDVDGGEKTTRTDNFKNGYGSNDAKASDSTRETETGGLTKEITENGSTTESFNNYSQKEVYDYTERNTLTRPNEKTRYETGSKETETNTKTNTGGTRQVESNSGDVTNTQTVTGDLVNNNTGKNVQSFEDYKEKNDTTGSNNIETTNNSDNNTTEKTTGTEVVNRTKTIDGDMGVSPTSKLLMQEVAFWANWNYFNAIMQVVADELGLRVRRVNI